MAHSKAFVSSEAQLFLDSVKMPAFMIIQTFFQSKMLYIVLIFKWSRLCRKESVGLGIRGYERPGFYSHWG